jgi:hypothetical protein
VASKGVLTIKVLGDARGLDKTLSGVTGTVKKLAIGFAGLAAMKEVGGFLVDCAKAAQLDRDRFMALQTVMKNQGQASAPLIASMKTFIDQARMATGVSEEQLVPALARIQAATKDVAMTQDLANVAMDVAVARNQDLESVATALAKAQQGNVTSLQRLGVAVKDAEGKTLSFDQILSNLKSTYGGTAAAVGATDPWKRLGQAFDILKEKIGEVLIPVLEKLAPAAMKFVAGLSAAVDAATASGDWSGIAGKIAGLLGDGIRASAPTIASAVGDVIKQIPGMIWDAAWDAGKASGERQAAGFASGFLGGIERVMAGAVAVLENTPEGKIAAGLAHLITGSKSSSPPSTKLKPPSGHQASLYDSGGYLPVGASIAVNNTGSPEPVVTSDSMDTLIQEVRGLRSDFKNETNRRLQLARAGAL